MGCSGQPLSYRLGDGAQVVRWLTPLCARLRELLLLNVVSETDQRRVGVSARGVESQDAVRFVLRRGPDSGPETGLSSALDAVRLVLSGCPGSRSGDGLPSALDPLAKIRLIGLRSTHAPG